MFDWINFVEKYKIDYRTDGPNCAKDHIVVKCPFCGNNDPSMHMGINLLTGFWGCWRDENHRGKRPHRLIMKLLNVDFHEAESIVNPFKKIHPNHDFFSVINEMIDKKRSMIKCSKNNLIKTRESLEFPNEFRSIANEYEKTWTNKFINYLRRRNFMSEHIREFCKRYNLLGSISGKYSNRIILPIFFNGRAVSWTARSISSSDNVRYLTLSKKDGAVLSLKDVVYEWPFKKEFDSLILVEGPFDMLKLDYYLEEYKIASTCLFGRVLTTGKIKHIQQISSRCQKIFILLDVDSFSNSLLTAQKLGHILHNKEIILLNLQDFADVKDPGDLTVEQVKKIGDKLSKF